MKENIYTIPVYDALRDPGECALCRMLERLEADAVAAMMGTAYMEDDIRMETDALGFCPKHFEQIAAKRNKLGLALIAHTHLRRVNTELAGLMERPATGRKLFAKKDDAGAKDIVRYLHSLHDSCYICNKIFFTFDMYIDTFFALWKSDEHMRELVLEGPGFCLSHFAELLSKGGEKLNASAFNAFYDTVAPLEAARLKGIEEDLALFIRKFDYRYRDEPWGSEKNAVERAVKKIASVDIDN